MTPKPAPETIPALVARLLEEHSTGPDYDGRCKHSADLRRLSRAVREMREFIQNDAELPTGLDDFRKNAAQRLLARLDEGGGE